VSSSSVSIVYGVSDGAATVSFDGGMATTLASGQTVSGLGDGSHTVTVYSTDIAGNVGSASVSFIVDSAADIPDDTNIVCQGTGTAIVGASSFMGSITPPSGGNHILIASPGNNSTLTSTTTIVTGATDTTAINSVIIVVTSGTTTVGYIAQVNGQYFAAKVPVKADTISFAAISTDHNGNQLQASVAVTVDPDAAASLVDLTASPGIGLPGQKGTDPASLDVDLTSTPSTPHAVASYSWDFDGSGSEDLRCYSHSKVKASYQNTGLYLSKVTIKDTQGHEYADTAIVNVVGKNELDAVLAPVWNRLKEALVSGNTTAALDVFIPGSREKYGDIFSALQDRIAGIASTFQNIEAVYVHENFAGYRIKKWQVINGENQLMTYYIYFARDENGQWKIDEF
jgi:hypothetical protein